MPFLSPKYLTIAMDTPGYGDSDKPPRQYNISDYARSVVDFLDALGIEKTSVLGDHTGAGIAGEVAASYPDRVDKLILSGYPLFTQEELAARHKGQLPEPLRKIEPLQLKEDGSHMIDIWNVAKMGEANQSLEDIHNNVVVILKGGPRNVEAHLALWRYEPQERLPLIKCPTLILMSKEDQFYSRAEAVKSLIPQSRVVIVEGGGSFFPRQSPELFAETVMAFLRDPGI